MSNKDQLYRLAIMTYLSVWYVGCFWLMAVISSGLYEHALGIDFIKLQDYTYYALAGAIGGTLYAMRLFLLYYDNLTEKWMLWYLLRPILCAGTAVMTIILFESGIMLLEAKDSVIAKIGIAFLVGFGYGKVMDKLKVLTETLFNSKDNSGPAEGEQKPK